MLLCRVSVRDVHKFAMSLILDALDFSSRNDVFHIVFHRPRSYGGKDGQSADSQLCPKLTFDYCCNDRLA